MTILEKQSLRKKKAILYLVDKGEYSLGYALLKVEELYDAGKLTDNDYNALANYIEELINKVEEAKENEEVELNENNETIEEQTEEIESNEGEE